MREGLPSGAHLGFVQPERQLLDPAACYGELGREPVTLGFQARGLYFE